MAHSCVAHHPEVVLPTRRPQHNGNGMSHRRHSNNTFEGQWLSFARHLKRDGVEAELPLARAAFIAGSVTTLDLLTEPVTLDDAIERLRLLSEELDRATELPR